MRNYFILVIFIFLSSCTVIDIANIAKDELTGSSPDIISSLMIEPPYEINGNWYYPKNYKEFKQIGIATAISSLEVGSKTSNGERYHPDVLTGAHASLALPSMVAVTNLSNGFTVNIRINHRGGFSNINTIELSPAVLNLLEINEDAGIVEINLINQNETFILKEARTYNAEKKVKNAPVSAVSIQTIDIIENDNINNNDTNINNINNDVKIKNVNKIEIYLKITQFSFKKSAMSFKNSVRSDLNIKIIETIKNDKKYYNVVLGPFDDMEGLYKMQKNKKLKLFEDLSLLIL